MTINLSPEGAAFIVAQEGSVDHWYRDSFGIWTIGVGHVGDPTVEFIDVALESDLAVGRRLSESEIVELFRVDVARYVQAVDRLVTVELTQPQADALIDFAYNWGIGELSGFPATSVLHMVNEGDFAAVAVELVDGRGPITPEYPVGRRYDKGLPGVRNRRKLEAAAFEEDRLTPVQIIEAAMAEMESLGITVHWQEGWETRGNTDMDPAGVVDHHTATPASAPGDYPSLYIVTNGVDQGGYFLPGPLANFGLGRSGAVYVIAARKANHAGSGSWGGVSGNYRMWGIEAENNGMGEPWPAAQVEAYLALNTALARHTRFDAAMVVRHAEWSTAGKIDTATAPMDNGSWIRQQVAARLAAVPAPEPILEEDDMWIIDAPASRGGGIYRTDGVRVIGVPNESWLNRFFFSGLIKHAGTAEEDLWDSFLNWDGTPRNPGVVGVTTVERDGVSASTLDDYPVLAGRVGDYAAGVDPLSCAGKD